MGRPKLNARGTKSIKVSLETAERLAALQKQMTRAPLNPPSLGEVVAVLVSERGERNEYTR